MPVHRGRGTPAALPFAVATLLLAGCAGDGGPPVPDGDANPTGGDGETASFVVEALPWAVGDSWTHHWTSPANGLDFRVRSIVVENASGAYTVATDDRTIAAQHGAFFFMDLGRMQDGTMAAGEFAFPWYEFPLTDNKTWTATETNLGGDFAPVTRDIGFTARQMGTGDGAHFMVEGRVEGKLYVAYDYVPDVGWFSEFRSYSLAADGEEPVLAFQIVNEGRQAGYTGPHYLAEGDLLVNEQAFVHPGGASSPAGAISFALASPHTDVFGLLYAFGAAGGERVQLVAPDGQEWSATGVGDADGNPVPLGQAMPSGRLVLTPAQAGDWSVAWGGAGVVAGGGAVVWGLAVAEGTL